MVVEECPFSTTHDYNLSANAVRIKLSKDLRAVVLLF
jgi:hypothetical protein